MRSYWQSVDSNKSTSHTAKTLGSQKPLDGMAHEGSAAITGEIELEM
jgi:hypothetical protein